jgi:hypothetical protein
LSEDSSIFIDEKQKGIQKIKWDQMQKYFIGAAA